MKKVYLQLALLLSFIIFSFPAFSSIYYVANTGNDANTGSITLPFLTIQRAQTSAVAGDTVYVRGGTYNMLESQIAQYSSIWAYVTLLSKSGTTNKRINYWNYPGEKPIFNYTAINPAGYRIHAFEVTGSWIHIKGLEVIDVQVNIIAHTQSECFENQGSYNIYEMLSMHDGKAIGFYLNKGGNNLILNCDAYNNWDNVSENQLGGNTDGFGCHPNNDNVGYINNVFRGCRAWFNSDDGYDCISAFEATRFENCWAFYNGYSQTFASLGDGNGFKAGGYGVSTTPSVPTVIPRNVIQFCLSIRNKSSGFYSNHHLGGSDWYSNSAYFNAVNYNMLNRSADYTADVNGYGHNMKNNLGWGGRSSEYANIDFNTCNADTNYFNLPVTVNAADFLSMDQALLTAPRQADGSLPVNNFMRLVAGSDVIDKGRNIGFTYYGTAPDLGCYESNYTSTPLNMLSFNANVNKQNNVLLNWEVVNQLQNKGWEIERNELLNNVPTAWKNIGFVAGNDNVAAMKYSFRDALLVAGTYQYRLKQMDKDGNYKYSNVLVVKISSNKTVGLSVFPNPIIDNATANYYITNPSKVQLSLYTADGRLVSKLLDDIQSAGMQTINIDRKYLQAKGGYILQFTSNEKNESICFVK